VIDRFYKSSDEVLTVDRMLKPKYSFESPRVMTYIFDFEFRTMSVITGYGSAGENISVHPFPTVDPALLERMREKLVELGGNPPAAGPLPGVKTAFAAPQALRGPKDGKPGAKP
jgi:hypothetical protein